MSNKKLLEESTVEKFMKLAKIDASKSKQFLTENFTEELEERDAESVDEMGAYGSMEEKEMGELEMPKMEEEVALEELDLFEEEEEERGEEEEDMGELAMSSEEAEKIIDTLEMLLNKLRMAVGAEEEEEVPGMRDVYEEAQTADDKEDEHLGAKDGKESGKKQSI